MAKYTINYACGHEKTVQLFGPTKERERKIAWMESQDCPQCWGKAKRAQEDASPILITVSTNGLDHDEQGAVLAEIILTGGTRPRKEEIKQLGYRWGDVRGGVMNFLSTKAPQKAWTRSVSLLGMTENEGKNEITARLQADADALGAKIKMSISALDVEMARQSIEKSSKKQAAAEAVREEIQALPKPVRPPSHPREAHEGYWNGKYYGREGSRNYYVEGVKYTLRDEEYEECMAYRKAISAYYELVEAMKESIA